MINCGPHHFLAEPNSQAILIKFPFGLFISSVREGSAYFIKTSSEICRPELYREGF